MELSHIKIGWIVLIVVIALAYFYVISRIKGKLKSGTRARSFKVGGEPRKSSRALPESREDRQERKEISLRDGPRLRRRFK